MQATFRVCKVFVAELRLIDFCCHVWVALRGGVQFQRVRDEQPTQVNRIGCGVVWNCIGCRSMGVG